MKIIAQELNSKSKEDLSKIYNKLCLLQEKCDGCPCNGMECCIIGSPKISKNDLINGIKAFQKQGQEVIHDCASCEWRYEIKDSEDNIFCQCLFYWSPFYLEAIDHKGHCILFSSSAEEMYQLRAKKQSPTAKTEA